MIRENLFRLLGDELPYACAVLIDKFEQEGRLRRIHASIIVDKDAHKGIVVGATFKHDEHVSEGVAKPAMGTRRSRQIEGVGVGID